MVTFLVYCISDKYFAYIFINKVESQIYPFSLKENITELAKLVYMVKLGS